MAQQFESLAEDPMGDGESPLKDLKTVILSIDWEITEEIMRNFIGEVEQLKKVYRNDQALLLFLQLLATLGEYIRSRLGQAHPDALKMLNSVFQAMEEVATTPGMSLDQKKRILSREAVKYRELQEKIISRTSRPVPGDPPARAPMPPPSQLPPAPELVEAITRAVRAQITDEFTALKTELKQWLSSRR